MRTLDFCNDPKMARYLHTNIDRIPRDSRRYSMKTGNIQIYTYHDTANISTILYESVAREGVNQITDISNEYYINGVSRIKSYSLSAPLR